MTSVSEFVYQKIEIPAFVGGAMISYASVPGTDILISLILALFTGAAGATGAHIAKYLLNKNKPNGNQETRKP